MFQIYVLTSEFCLVVSGLLWFRVYVVCILFWCWCGELITLVGWLFILRVGWEFCILVIGVYWVRVLCCLMVFEDFVVILLLCVCFVLISIVLFSYVVCCSGLSLFKLFGGYIYMNVWLLVVYLPFVCLSFAWLVWIDSLIVYFGLLLFAVCLVCVFLRTWLLWFAVCLILLVLILVIVLFSLVYGLDVYSFI